MKFRIMALSVFFVISLITLVGLSYSGAFETGLELRAIDEGLERGQQNAEPDPELRLDQTEPLNYLSVRDRESNWRFVRDKGNECDNELCQMADGNSYHEHTWTKGQPPWHPCADGLDNDGNGLIDTNDDACDYTNPLFQCRRNMPGSGPSIGGAAQTPLPALEVYPSGSLPGGYDGGSLSPNLGLPGRYAAYFEDLTQTEVVVESPNGKQRVVNIGASIPHNGAALYYSPNGKNLCLVVAGGEDVQYVQVNPSDLRVIGTSTTNFPGVTLRVIHIIKQDDGTVRIVACGEDAGGAICLRLDDVGNNCAPATDNGPLSFTGTTVATIGNHGDKGISGEVSGTAASKTTDGWDTRTSIDLGIPAVKIVAVHWINNELVLLLVNDDSPNLARVVYFPDCVDALAGTCANTPLNFPGALAGATVARDSIVDLGGGTFIVGVNQGDGTSVAYYLSVTGGSANVQLVKRYGAGILAMYNTGKTTYIMFSNGDTQTLGGCAESKDFMLQPAA